MNEAQPIGTARKVHGTRLLLFRPGPWGPIWEIGSWDDDKANKRPRPFWRSECAWLSMANQRNFNPTHWLPLPANPPSE